MAEDGVNINIDKIFLRFDQALNRERYFSRIGQHGAENINSIEDWGCQIDEFTYSLATPSQETKEAFKNLFPLWLSTNLIRDIIEHFTYGYENIYHSCLVASLASDGVIPANSSYDLNRLKSFKDAGLDDKRKILKKDFGIDFSKHELKEIFKSFKDIRNCLSHNRGIVDKDMGHSGKNGKRKIGWYTYKFYIGTAEKKIKLKIGQIIEGPASLILKIDKHNKEFNVGEQILFSRVELFEIANTFEQLKKDLLMQIVSFLEQHITQKK